MRFFHDCWYVCWRELLHFLRSEDQVRSRLPTTRLQYRQYLAE